MVRLSAGIELMFTERDFLSRLEAAAGASIPAVELWGWRDKDIEALDEQRKRNRIDIAVLNLDPPVNVLQGNATAELQQSLRETCRAAIRLGCNLITCHLQEVPAGSGQVWYDFLYDDEKKSRRQKQKQNYLAALKAAVPIAGDYGVTLLLEPLNTLVDHAGYFLSSSLEAAEIIREVNHPCLGMLFDCYHQQITEGNLTANLLNNLDLIKHIHLADVPGRHEPGTGEINFRNLLQAVTEAGYKGYIGLEYSPTKETNESLRYIKSVIEEIDARTG